MVFSQTQTFDELGRLLKNIGANTPDRFSSRCDEVRGRSSGFRSR